MSTTNPNVVYVRRMLSGDDPAFDRGNRDWNTERPKHLTECLGTAIRLLDVSRFVEFHRDRSEEFNYVSASLELAAARDESWFDQDSSKELCSAILNVTIELIESILTLVERV
jgi:hypothetical protein